MQTIEEMASFVKLWDLVQQVQLNNESDSIYWRWTVDGTYIARSIYSVQFVGPYNNFNGASIWKAKGSHNVLKSSHYALNAPLRTGYIHCPSSHYSIH